MTRRVFLDLSKALGALLVAVGSLPTLFSWWRSASVDSGVEPWIDFGLAREIPEEGWLLRKISVEQRNRWRQEVTEESVYLRRVGRDLTVLSSVCPHARCLVRSEGEGFACPCHSSSFDADGRVLNGPSPRALDELEWKVEKGRLKVHVQQFRPGVSKQEALKA